MLVVRVCRVTPQDLSITNDEHCPNGMVVGAMRYARPLSTSQSNKLDSMYPVIAIKLNKCRVIAMQPAAIAAMKRASYADQTCVTFPNDMRGGTAFACQRCRVDLRHGLAYQTKTRV
jgi:hypothetical protein